MGETHDNQHGQHHFSVSHKSGKTAMIWRSDGTQHPGPRNDFNVWDKALTPKDVKTGNGFIELGKNRFRVGVMLTAGT